MSYISTLKNLKQLLLSAVYIETEAKQYYVQERLIKFAFL
ncbi:hypothetical protein PARC_a3245 [Pseudoalteromonas arctica A 37-1-2]|uniref:Uncharacterized protein n=1 Tax=Pseudoalteromonas arctica A 37-1-2 TaxID=1117313 RepID=A0A290S6G0_9GAMM|nr:hypothetical protein PARC_a3245 [Pseudoalteromonas arctica A 37-1-2]